jgi:hypothetical protein
MNELILTSRIYGEKIFLIDDEEWDRVSKYKWHLHKDIPSDHFYVYGTVNGQSTSLARFIMMASADKIVDHIDGNTFDNRKRNLRICTKRQNSINRRKSRTAKNSKFKGAYFNKRNSEWWSHIKSEGKLYRDGPFYSEVDAARAYNIRAIELYGEYARLNEIGPYDRSHRSIQLKQYLVRKLGEACSFLASLESLEPPAWLDEAQADIEGLMKKHMITATQKEQS